VYNKLLEARAFPELGAYFTFRNILKSAAKGDGHSVLVLPGFLTTDSSTVLLRNFLSRQGFDPHPWKLGRNTGPLGVVEDKVVKQVETLFKRSGRKVSLVGWSLGGLYAREVAIRVPEFVRSVVTLGTPLRPNNERFLNSMYTKLSGQDVSELDSHLLDRFDSKVPVPLTAIISRTDGFVPWKLAVGTRSGKSECIFVRSSHTGMIYNPLVLWSVSERLSVPEDAWRPFRRKGLRKFLYQHSH